MQRDALDNLNSVIQEIELDDHNEKNEEIILPFKTLERKSSVQPLNSQTSIVFSGKKTTKKE